MVTSKPRPAYPQSLLHPLMSNLQEGCCNRTDFGFDAVLIQFGCVTRCCHCLHKVAVKQRLVPCHRREFCNIESEGSIQDVKVCLQRHVCENKLLVESSYGRDNCLTDVAVPLGYEGSRGLDQSIP